MSVKDNSKNTNNPRYSNGINEMEMISNFGVLPSKQSTPASSSTPGPPPFNIIQTPFFDGSTYDYSLNTETLKHMNENPNSFDIDRNAEQREGYVRDPGIYHTIINQPNGSKLYSHLTISSEITPRTPQPQITKKRPSSIDGQSPFEVTQESSIQTLSPSLLQRPVTPQQISKPISMIHDEPPPIQPLHTIQAPPPHPPQPIIDRTQSIQPIIRSIPRPNYVWEHTPSWLSDLSVALNRMGINAITVIIIIMAVFIAVQIRQFNILRDPNINISKHPSPDTSIYDDLFKKMQELNRTLTKQINDTEDRMKNKTKGIEDKINANKVNIDSNTKKTEGIQGNISNVTQRIDDVEHDVDNTVRHDDISALKAYYGYQSQTNWIFAIESKPKTIPLAYNDHGSLTLLEQVGRGMGLIHDSLIGESENEVKPTGNTNIAHSDTPNTLNPHDCLQFATKKEDRWIEIRLIQKLIVKEFEYIHIDKTKINAEDRNKSPKRFRLKGKVRGGNWTDIDVKEDKIMTINQSQIKLELIPKIGIELIRIEYDINEDAKSTRLYRFRVHGDPDVYGFNVENNENIENE